MKKKKIKEKQKKIKKSKNSKNSNGNITIFKKWIKTKINQILEEMILDFVHIEIKFINKNTQLPNKWNSNTVFTMDYTKKYRQVVINIYPEAYNIFIENRPLLIDGLVHELTHIHTIPFTDMALKRNISQRELMDASEELTETFSEYIRRYIKQKKNNKIYN